MIKLPEKDFYVVLTGSKNNAGDFLIKHQAKRLLKQYRPDRDVIDLNAWESMTPETLELVNKSKALILLGGPSLQFGMYPGIYNLPKDLNEIKTPILTMGIGWKSISGEWEDCFNYSLSSQTMELLKVINSSKVASSVRDLHTLTALQSHGFNNFRLTGCPALYNQEYDTESKTINNEVKTVAFSLGVSFLNSPSMKMQMKDLIKTLKERCQSYSQKFIVVFHHSLDEKVVKSSSGNKKHLAGHLEFVNWLKEINADYVDISGSAENLIEFYDEVDFHIGYRVHAHIYMCSLGKKSLLISEDGRANSLQATIGGNILKGYSKYKSNKLTRLMKMDAYTVPDNLTEIVINRFDYEIENTQFTNQAVANIQTLNKVMLEFISSLP